MGMDFFSNEKLGIKVLIVFIGVNLIGILSISVTAYFMFSASMEHENFNKLTSVREINELAQESSGVAQNAASSEELAATAKELKHQASELSRLVGLFRVEDQEVGR